MELNSIAFIPDGNRRFAKQSGLQLLNAYQLGTQKAWDVMDWIAKYPQIKVGTFYTLSLENLYGRKEELKILFKIFEHELDKVKEGSKVEANQTRLKFIGRLELFPKSLREKIAKAEKFSENFSNKTINLAIGYNGQAEIVDAAKKIATDFKANKLDLDSLNQDNFKKYLYGQFQEPDLIVRTSGTQRLSGFLTYQSSYSELYFINKFWPQLTEQDVDLAVQEFDSRQRRFGK
ncbi:MAG: polyprenyl diphosphate synthase [archaeon]|nr:polyprenyl diphosphate synthase [archaeon]